MAVYNLTPTNWVNDLRTLLNNRGEIVEQVFYDPTATNQDWRGRIAQAPDMYVRFLYQTLNTAWLQVSEAISGQALSNAFSILSNGSISFGQVNAIITPQVLALIFIESATPTNMHFVVLTKLGDGSIVIPWGSRSVGIAGPPKHIRLHVSRADVKPIVLDPGSFPLVTPQGYYYGNPMQIATPAGQVVGYLTHVYSIWKPPSSPIVPYQIVDSKHILLDTANVSAMNYTIRGTVLVLNGNL